MVRVVVWISTRIINGEPGFSPASPAIDCQVDPHVATQLVVDLSSDGWDSILSDKQITLRPPSNDVVVAIYQ